MEDYSLMDYLQGKGIHPDMRVTVKEKEPYEGPILLATEAGDISLSYKAVEQILLMNRIIKYTKSLVWGSFQ